MRALFIMAAPIEQGMEGIYVTDFKDNEERQRFLDLLPDEILLKVLKLLPTVDLLSVCEVNHRLNKICEEVLRHINLQTCYAVTPGTLSVLRTNVKGSDIQTLNISHCYWLKASDFRSLPLAMPNLQCLDIRGTAVSLKMLMKMLSSAKSLTSLSFEHRWSMRSSDFGKKALATWSQLSEINVAIKTCLDCSIFEFCNGLKALTIDVVYLEGEDHNCYCDGILYIHRRQHQLDYLFASLGIPARHPRFYLGLIELFPGKLKNRNRCQCCFACWNFCPFFSGNKECSQVMATYPPQSISLVAKSPQSLANVQHLFFLSHCSQRMKEELAVVTKCSHLTTLNISTCFPSHRDLAELPSSIEETLLEFLETLGKKKIPLQHLNLDFFGILHLHMGDKLALALGKLTGLKSLSLPICSLSGCSQSQPAWMTSPPPTTPEAGLRSGSSKRVGPKTNNYIRCDSCAVEIESPSQHRKPRQEQIVGNCIYCGSNLGQIVNGTPEMESLELLTQGSSSFTVFKTYGTRDSCTQSPSCPESNLPDVSEDTLLCISRWTNLRSLVLFGLPAVLHGHCLVPIAQNCKQLRYLSIGFLGHGGQCQVLSNLCAALPLTQRLQDLRLEHKNIDGMSSLFRALQTCKSLRRLCIISKNSSVKPADVLQTFSHCPKLIVLCLITSMMVKDCRHLKQELMGRFGKSCPALQLCITNWDRAWEPEYLASLADVHLKEFILFRSRVANVLPSWYEWKVRRSVSRPHDTGS